VGVKITVWDWIKVRGAIEIDVSAGVEIKVGDWFKIWGVVEFKVPVGVEITVRIKVRGEIKVPVGG
jgi:hypothetical protein